jgi:hypothetical protein
VLLLASPTPLHPTISLHAVQSVRQEYEIDENLQASITMHYSRNTHCSFHLTSPDSCKLVKANEEIKKLSSEKQ